jgi:hypothetical protein
MKKNKLYRLLFVLLIMFSVNEIKSANRTWVGTTSSWNLSTNWNPAGVPIASDTVIFSNAANCSIDIATVSVAGFKNTGYTGIITQSATNTSLTLGSSGVATVTVLFASGTFTGNAIATTNIIINGKVTYSGGTFTSTVGKLTLNNSINSTGGIFNHNNGTVIFNSAALQVIPAWSFYNITSSSTGSRTFASVGTVFIFKKFIKTNASIHTVTGSTINYAGTIGQTIVAMNYNNLTISGNHTGNIDTLENSASLIGIAGAFVVSATGGYTRTGSTVNFNGGNQTIPAFQFNNLQCNVLSNVGLKTASGSIIVDAVLTINASATLDMAVANTLTGGFTTAGAGTLKTQNVSGTPIPTTKTWNFSVEYNSTAAQSIVAGIYAANLICTGTGAIKSASGAVVVNTPGVITVNGTSILDMATFALTGTFVSTNGTGKIRTQNALPVSKIWGTPVEYYGTLAQTVAIGTYSNLEVSGTRGVNAITFGNGTINVSGPFVFSAITSAALGIASNTFNYNGTGIQTVIAINYNNLTISGARTTNNVTLANTGTIGIAGVYTPSATFSQGASIVVAGSTINYNGTVAQTVTAATYHHLIIAATHGANAVTLASGTIDLKGNFSNLHAGTNTTTGNTLLFSGTAYQYIIGGTAPAVNLQKLSVNKPTGRLILSKPTIVAQQLILTSGIIGSSAVNLLTINNNAVVADTLIGGSDLSYVAGPVKKIGNQAFTFPLGDTVLATGAYHPLKITAPTTTADEYTGKYTAAGPSTIPLTTTTLQPDSLESISTCEYFTLIRGGTTTSVVIPTISWNTNSCNVATYDNLRAAYWDPNPLVLQWKTMGAGVTTVRGPMGTVSGSFGFGTATLYIAIGKYKKPSNYCAILRRELDGGYHTVVNGNLTFKYDEEYADLDGKLTFNIYNAKNIIVASNLTMPILTQPLVRYGDNRITLNIASCSFTPTGNLGTGFYILEVINEKNEKWYLRFKHNLSLSGLCAATSGIIWSP